MTLWGTLRRAAALAALLGTTGWLLPGLPPQACGQADLAGSCPGCARLFDGYGLRQSDAAFELVWVMDRTVYPKVFTLANPERLVVDFQPAWSERLERLNAWTHPLLNGPVRRGSDSAQRRVRFVLDLVPGAAYDVRQDIYLNAGQLGEGARFVLRVSRGGPP
jgi:hypothetical protein